MLTNDYYSPSVVVMKEVVYNMILQLIMLIALNYTSVYTVVRVEIAI